MRAAITSSATGRTSERRIKRPGAKSPPKGAVADAWREEGAIILHVLVAGDVTGDLRTELTALQITGPIWHVEFNWIIDAGQYSFTAHLKGTLNTLTGQVVMNGTVVDGWLLGAQVHEEGQLVDPNTLRFQGTIQIMPATSD